MPELPDIDSRLLKGDWPRTLEELEERRSENR